MNKANNVRRLGSGSVGLVPVEMTAEAQTPLLRQYWRIVWRWRRVILGIIGVCLVLGLIITLLMTPQYTATNTIEISRESGKIVNIQGVEQEATDSDQEFYQTQYGLLRARSLAEQVATRLRLVDDVAFFEMFDEADDEGLFTDSSDRRLSAVSRSKRVKKAGEILLDNIRITPARQSRLVEISFTSPDPALSQRVANAWSENFISATLERRYEATSYARRFLESRLAQLRTRLDASERSLQNYASNERIITLPQGKEGSEQSTIAYDLVALNGVLAVATADRLAVEGKYKASRGRSGDVGEALDNNALNALRARRAERAGEYEKLLVQFEPDYPPLRAAAGEIRQLDRSIAREEQRIGSSLAAEYQAAVNREESLRERVDALKESFLDQRRRSIQYNIFQREVDTNRQLYDALLQRYKEIGIAGGVGVNNVAVVDEAQLPSRPSSPRLVLNLVLALFVGMSLGAIAAFILEQSDEAIADPGAVERMLGLPLLGSVPKSSDSPIDALRDRKSSIVDAYLAVQTNLQFSTDHGVPQSLAVTSSRPAEGKSTTSFALATMLARADRKVVLIDGDMRSPSVHHLIGAQNDRGLSNYLSGGAVIDSLLVPVNDFGFVAMTAGPIPPNAAELLTGNRLASLIEELSKHFDHIVIDSPPVMGLADAPLIGSRVEGIVYAVESHGIRASIVRTALSRLASANARIIGVVVTKFEPKKAHFGYDYDYGYGYGRSEQGRGGNG